MSNLYKTYWSLSLDPIAIMRLASEMGQPIEKHELSERKTELMGAVVLLIE